MILVGSYSDSKEGGIYNIETDENGKLLFICSYESGANASFLTIFNNKIIAVNEVDGKINLSKFNLSDNNLTNRTEYSSGGIGPCHLLNIDDKMLLCSNYTDGSLSLLDNNLELKDNIKHYGSSINNLRQESSHIHCAIYNRCLKVIYAVDLGADKVFTYRVNSDYKLIKVSTFNLKPGDGPRLMVINRKGDRGYIVNELSNSVITLSLNSDGSITEIKRYSTLPLDLEVESYASHITLSPDEKFLLISNRGHDSIVTFNIKKDILSDPKWASVEGAWPRHFSFVDNGRYIIVTNQNSNKVSSFKFENGEIINNKSNLTIKNPTIILPVK